MEPFGQVSRVHAHVQLPNLIAQSQGKDRIVPEFVPHFGAVGPVVDAVDELLRDEMKRQQQVRDLRAVGDAFRGLRFTERAADVIMKTTGI